MFERPFYDDPKIRSYSSDDANYQDYSLFNNAWWLIVVTMTTVGYGDYFPRTHLGRTVVILACFCGVFIMSLSVVTLTSASEFTRGEKSTYEILHRLKQRKAIQNLARRVIFYNIRYFYLRKKIDINNPSVELSTEIRNIKELNLRYEIMFHNKRKSLLQVDRMEHVRYDYSKIQKRIGTASIIEENLKGILEEQEDQGNYFFEF